MKKVLGIIFLFFFFTFEANANCKKDIEFSWSLGGSDIIANFKFLNNGNKPINIQSISFLTSDSQIIKTEKFYSKKILPFGKTMIYVLIDDIQLRYLKYASYKCKYSSY